MIIKKGLFLAGGNFFSSLANFFAVYVIYNKNSLQDFGVISLLLTFGYVFQIIFNSQSAQGVLKYYCYKNNSVIKKVFSIDLTYSILGSLLLSLTLFFFVKYGIEKDPEKYYNFLFFSLIVMFVPNGAFLSIIRGEGLFYQQSIIDILAASMRLLLSLCLMLLEYNSVWVVLIFVIPDIIKWLGYLIIFMKNLNSEQNDDDCDFETIKRIYKFSFWSMMTEIVHLPTSHLDKIIVAGIVGIETLGIWEIIKRTTTFVAQGTVAINQVLYPYFLNLMKFREFDKLIKNAIIQIIVISSTVFVIYCFAWLFFPQWFGFLFARNNNEFSIESLQKIYGFLALVMVFTLGATPLHPLFLTIRNSKESFYISILGNILFLFSSLILLRIFGLNGAVLAILFSDLFIITFKSVLIIKHCLNKTKFIYD